MSSASYSVVCSTDAPGALCPQFVDENCPHAVRFSDGIQVARWFELDSKGIAFKYHPVWDMCVCFIAYQNTHARVQSVCSCASDNKYVHVDTPSMIYACLLCLLM